jgi:hypothetical protein
MQKRLNHPNNPDILQNIQNKITKIIYEDPNIPIEYNEQFNPFGYLIPMFNENKEQWIKLVGSRQSFTYECNFCDNFDIKHNLIWELELANNTFDEIDWILSDYNYGSIQALLDHKYGNNSINQNMKSGICNVCNESCKKLATFDFSPIIFIRDDVRRNKKLICHPIIILNCHEYNLFGRILYTNEISFQTTSKANIFIVGIKKEIIVISRLNFSKFDSKFR